MATVNDVKIGQLIAAADQASASGGNADAARLLAEAQTLAPKHPAVLNALGMHALKTGQFPVARRYLEEAVHFDAGTALRWFHLALVCRAQADASAERVALDKALAADPYFYLALLQKATLLERQGKRKQAAQTYSNFLDCLPQGAHEAPALQPAIQHARQAMAANNAELEQFIRGRLGESKQHPGGAGRERFDHCLDALLRKRRIFTPQPTFMHFPKLPALEFHERADFPWLDAFEAASGEIRTELVNLLAADAGGVVPYVDYPDGAPLNQWKDLNRSTRWGAYYLINSGVRLEDHLARCPKTAALLDSAPLANVPGQAPTAFFSLLEPHTHIPAHTGVTNTRLVVHVPLIVPPGCRFRVGSETREWQAGRAWVFDDTIEHEAWNDSDAPRAILIIDTWNPFLTAAERELVSAATVSVTEFYRD